MKDKLKLLIVIAAGLLLHLDKAHAELILENQYQNRGLRIVGDPRMISYGTDTSISTNSATLVEVLEVLVSEDWNVYLTESQSRISITAKESGSWFDILDAVLKENGISATINAAQKTISFEN